MVFENKVWLPEVVYVYVPAGGEPGGDDAGTRVDGDDEPAPAVPPEPPDPPARAAVVADVGVPELPVPAGARVDAEADAVVVVTPDPFPAVVEGVSEFDPPPGDPGPGPMLEGDPAPLRWSLRVVPMPMAAPAPTTRSAAATAPTALTPVVTDESLIWVESYRRG